MCLNVTDPNFDHVGSSVAIFHPGNPEFFERSRDQTAYSLVFAVDDFLRSWSPSSI
ncbi:hypothetical protein KIN20_025683 [Parelaphostrongylus tenuis]|uniref:Uncharacterized protein n=1 Tax=Parelaphostrongylus tenuis TaxID=148309 RepID=A0AAD5QXT6_PARTN|nr:hypothetical protein KIN20_025683 [Parelaphostrongylus tenuis]